MVCRLRTKIKYSYMKNSFSKIFIQLKLVIVSLTIMSSCVETPVETTFIMTKENTSFSLNDTIVPFQKSKIVLTKVSSFTSSMPKYTVYSYFVDSIVTPANVTSVFNLISLTTKGLHTGEFQFDNSGASFLPGEYKVYLGIYSVNGKTIFRNNPVKVTILPGYATQTTNLTGLNYTFSETRSQEGNVIFTAYGLTANDFKVTSPENFEISLLSGTSFSVGNHSLNFPAVAELTPTKFYVRLKSGLSVGQTYTDSISIETVGVSKRYFPVSGKVAPISIKTDSTSITTGLTYAFGKGPSPEQKISVSGDVIGNVTLTCSPEFEISKSTGTGFTSTLTLTKTSNIPLATATIRIRLKAGLAIGKHSGTITLNSTNAPPVTVILQGAVN